MKLCKDCKWCKPKTFFWMEYWPEAVCLNPTVNEAETVRDYVTGEMIIPKFEPVRCNDARPWNMIRCTIDALYFEPKS